MSVCINALNCSNSNISEGYAGLYRDVMLELVPGWIYSTDNLEYLPWIWALIGSVLIGLSGVLPLLVIPIDESDNLKQGAGANTLKTLLSFAVGGLLGDVFLHSLPEIWANDVVKNVAGNSGHASKYSGLLVLAGLMVFVAAEKFFSTITQFCSCETEDVAPLKLNNNTKGYDAPEEKTDTANNNNKQITGYLNLLANAFDNFTHGLSIGGAFIVSFRLGCFTTFAILIHEIPHEVGDFAILLKSGFSRWDATKGQIITAAGGLVGSLAAISFSGTSNTMDARTSWILPFTSGTFLHIALVTVLPDLLKEEDPHESLKQLSALILGISVMGFVGSFFD